MGSTLGWGVIVSPNVGVRTDVSGERADTPFLASAVGESHRSNPGPGNGTTTCDHWRRRSGHVGSGAGTTDEDRCRARHTLPRRSRAIAYDADRSSPCRCLPLLSLTLSLALLVRNVDGRYRPARAEEVSSQARRVMAQQARRGETMSSPPAVKDYPRVETGMLEREVFCVLFLAHSHPFGCSRAEPCRRVPDADSEVGTGAGGHARARSPGGGGSGRLLFRGMWASSRLRSGQRTLPRHPFGLRPG